jgi:hypothetical protein
MATPSSELFLSALNAQKSDRNGPADGSYCGGRSPSLIFFSVAAARWC